MRARGCLTLFVLVGLCLVCSGCTSEPDHDTVQVPVASPTLSSPPAISAVTTVPPAVPGTTIPVTSPTTERITELPPERQVNLVLTKDRPTSEIHLLYQGGPGEIYVNRIMMRVHFSDTGFREYIMSNGNKPIPGDEIIAPGTRGGDRCEVFVISAGTRFKVIDQPVWGGMYY